MARGWTRGATDWLWNVDELFALERVCVVELVDGTNACDWGAAANAF